LIRKQFESDTMLIPKETAWFGYYEDEGFDTLLSAQQVNFSKLFHGSFGLWKSNMYTLFNRQSCTEKIGLV